MQGLKDYTINLLRKIIPLLIVSPYTLGSSDDIKSTIRNVTEAIITSKMDLYWWLIWDMKRNQCTTLCIDVMLLSCAVLVAN